MEIFHRIVVQENGEMLHSGSACKNTSSLNYDAATFSSNGSSVSLLQLVNHLMAHLISHVASLTSLFSLVSALCVSVSNVTFRCVGFNFAMWLKGNVSLFTYE